MEVKVPVHRISDAAEKTIKREAEKEGVKPAAWLDQLVRDYERGLSFDHA